MLSQFAYDEGIKKIKNTRNIIWKQIIYNYAIIAKLIKTKL